GSTTVHMLRVILRIASKNGDAVIGDDKMMERLGVTLNPLRAARREIKKFGFEISKGVGRGYRTTYWHPKLRQAAADAADIAAAAKEKRPTARPIERPAPRPVPDAEDAYFPARQRVVAYEDDPAAQIAPGERATPRSPERPPLSNMK